MVQKIKIGKSISGVGIIPVLILAGIILNLIDILPKAGTLMIILALFFSAAYGFLGIVGIMKKNRII